MSKRLAVLNENIHCYDILFSRSYDELWSELEKLEANNRRLCIVTDSNVDPLYGQRVQDLLSGKCKKAIKYVFPAGEQYKTLDTVRDLYAFLIEEQFDRRDMLIALGGGVVGDLTGFAAATYLRGIDFIQLPTTLLAQTDSSIGGKTGVDFDGYKNMVGAFRMPKLVYMNFTVLDTLEERQFLSGFAEVMKHGLLGDVDFYNWLLQHQKQICKREPSVLEEMLYRSCSIKKEIVEQDPTEQGNRALLNLGHTIGHAIEKAKDFTLYHGECVALGIVASAWISHKKGFLTAEEYTKIRNGLLLFALPVTTDGFSPESIVLLTKSDKKMEAGTVKFILMNGIGKGIINRTVSEEEMLEAIDRIYDYREECHE